MRRILLLLLLGCGVPRTGQEVPRTFELHEEAPEVVDLGGGWVEAVGEALIANLTPEEAKRRALQDARERAVMYVVGVKVQEEILDVVRSEGSGEGEDLRRSFLDISQHTSFGRIVEEKPPRCEMVVLEPPGGPSVQVYRCRLRAKVAREEGRPDPDFKVAVSLNKYTFRDGEEMSMEITSTQDCYITVLSVSAEDTVYVLLPHEYRRDNFLRAGGRMSLPGEEERRMGITYRVRLPEGMERATELIKVIATKRPCSLGAGWEKAGGFNYVPTPRAALEALCRWLVGIPLDQRTEAQATYLVTR